MRGYITNIQEWMGALNAMLENLDLHTHWRVDCYRYQPSLLVSTITWSLQAKRGGKSHRRRSKRCNGRCGGQSAARYTADKHTFYPIRDGALQSCKLHVYAANIVGERHTSPNLLADQKIDSRLAVLVHGDILYPSERKDDAAHVVVVEVLSLRKLHQCRSVQSWVGIRAWGERGGKQYLPREYLSRDICSSVPPPAGVVPELLSSSGLW